jgi:hypothetical protein
MVVTTAIGYECSGVISRCSVMWRFASIVFVVACTPARAPVAPTGGEPVTAVASEAAAPSDAATSNDTTGATSSGATGATSSDAGVAACRYDKPDSSAVLPATGLATPDERLCDLTDRIILVGPKLVTVITRPALKRVRAKIDRTEHLGDRCGNGPGGGHAGCSITYDRFWSAALPDHHLEFGTNAGNLLEDDRDPNHSVSCRNDSDYGVIATCSTARRFVVIKYQESGSCWTVHAQLWEGAADRPQELDGDVDRTASVGALWRFRFPAVSVDFDVHKRSATLDVGGDREACVVFRLSR